MFLVGWDEDIFPHDVTEHPLHDSLMGMETSSLSVLLRTSPQTFLKQAEAVNIEYILSLAAFFFFSLGLAAAVVCAQALPAVVAVSVAGQLVVSQGAGCNRM